MTLRDLYEMIRYLDPSKEVMMATGGKTIKICTVEVKDGKILLSSKSGTRASRKRGRELRLK